MSGPLRVLVVEDSLTVRKRLIEVLGSDPGLQVVGETADGDEAVAMCMRLRPDVITLDMVLSGISGLAVTEQVMGHCPTPILIVSASMNRGEVFQTFEALAAGAVEVLDKPSGGQDDLDWERRLVDTVKLVARIKVVTHPRVRLMGRAPALRKVETRQRDRAPALVAIGASTGGPGAIAQVLRGLPPRFSLPILLVLHIAQPFEASLIEWLNNQSGFNVVAVADGVPVPGAGTVAMAPSDRHLILRDGRLRLTLDPEVHSCRPAVDLLFESLARELGPRAIGCLLTGMGRDGARGLLAMRRAGATTLAQDEASSVVFGMPHEAIKLGAAERVVPLGEMASALAALTGTGAP